MEKVAPFICPPGVVTLCPQKGKGILLITWNLSEQYPLSSNRISEGRPSVQCGATKGRPMKECGVTEDRNVVQCGVYDVKYIVQWSSSGQRTV